MIPTQRTTSSIIVNSTPYRVAEEITYSGKPEEIRDSFRSGIMRLVMDSGSIKINEKEQSKKLKGLNIVVYSNDRKCVIDSVNFDTFDQNYTCHR